MASPATLIASTLRHLLRPSRPLRIAAGLTLAVAIVSLLVGGNQSAAVGLLRPPWDKVAHLVAYAGFATLFIVATAGIAPTWVAILFIALLGAVDETVQSYVPGRSADLLDWLTDVTAAVLVVAVIALSRRYVDHRRRQESLPERGSAGLS
jgi:hypothetical protein